MEYIKDNQREELELAYMAGIMDGEGSIRIRKVHQKNEKPEYKYQVAMQMVNTDYETVKLFADFMGGTTIRVQDPGYKFRPMTNKTCYQTYKSGTVEVLKYIKILYPYLRIKKKNADLAIELCEKGEKFVPRKGMTQGKERITPEEARRRERIFQEYKLIIRPQRLNEKIPEMVKR